VEGTRGAIETTAISRHCRHRTNFELVVGKTFSAWVWVFRKIGSESVGLHFCTWARKIYFGTFLVSEQFAPFPGLT